MAFDVPNHGRYLKGRVMQGHHSARYLSEYHFVLVPKYRYHVLVKEIKPRLRVKVVSEVSTDMSQWTSSKQFASCLGLCPRNKVSGGKRLRGKIKTVASRAATALRMAANGLHRSKSALGAYMRRQKARLGAPKAITATAHKLARLIYSMLKHGMQYVDAGQDYYEQRFRTRVVENLERRASELGFELVKTTLRTETRNQ